MKIIKKEEKRGKRGMKRNLASPKMKKRKIEEKEEPQEAWRYHVCKMAFSRGIYDTISHPLSRVKNLEGSLKL